jgi:hypothetical protein
MRRGQWPLSRRTGGKWLCDIYLLARQRLARLGIRRTCRRRLLAP